MNQWNLALRRAAYLGLAPAVCLVLYWRVFFTWFVNDDFAWLGLPLEVTHPGALWHVFFAPQAQGTVRFISERLFFLIFSALFGFHALPYRIWIMGTWFADLTLAVLIGTRLTRSRAAAVVAAVLWTISVPMITPLAWASAYNEVACAFFILTAFYARLRWLEGGQRKWVIVEWIAYLAGFGALEVTVMYPFLVLLHSFTEAKPSRARQQAVLPLFIPAVVFSAIHFVFIPKNTSPYYVLKVDWQLPFTFLHYLGLATSYSKVDSGEPWPVGGLLLSACVTLALAVFVITRLVRREFAAVFCVGWFVLLLAPMLPLPNHLTEYYLAIPMAGLAWLGGWGIVTAWKGGQAARVVAVVLAAIYLDGSAREIAASSRWYRDRSEKMRTVVLGLRDQARLHPGAAFVIEGIDDDVYRSGFKDDPFRLLRLDRIYLAGDAKDVEDRFVINPDRALGLLKTGRARALSYSPEGLRDVTDQYEAMLIAGSDKVRHDFVDIGDPMYALLLGPTWYPAEKGFRWMPRSASVRISGPKSPTAKLHVTGFAPDVLFTGGPPVLHFRIGERDIGTATVPNPDVFALDFPVPPDFAGQNEVEILIEVNKAVHPGGEPRDLGMIFGTFEFK